MEIKGPIYLHISLQKFPYISARMVYAARHARQTDSTTQDGTARHHTAHSTSHTHGNAHITRSTRHKAQAVLSIVARMFVYTSFEVVEPLSLVVLDVRGQVSAEIVAPALAPHLAPAATLREGIHSLHLRVLLNAAHGFFSPECAAVKLLKLPSSSRCRVSTLASCGAAAIRAETAQSFVQSQQSQQSQQRGRGRKLSAVRIAVILL